MLGVGSAVECGGGNGPGVHDMFQEPARKRRLKDAAGVRQVRVALTLS